METLTPAQVLRLAESVRYWAPEEVPARLPHEIVSCSFCNKSQREVRKLIAGPAAYICDECINLCVDIIHE